MVPLHASIIFKLLATGISLALPSSQDIGDTVKDASTQQTSPKFQLLVAPLYRNVTTGQAWVYPSSPFDLGARSMSCACFNADYECCMPKPTSLGPFCMPVGSSCCANTFCVAGDTCCGEFCCPTTTTCNINVSGSGCCPIGAICSGPSICYDHASSNCTNTPDPKQQCCPSDLPYCRNFPPIGLGCYASSTMSTASTTVPSMTAAATSGILFGPTTSLPHSPTITVTVSVVSHRGSLSLAFPKQTVSGALEKTKYVLAYGSNSVIPLSVDTSTVLPPLVRSHLATSSAASSMSVSTPSTSSSKPSAPSSKPPPTSSTTSPLCFNPALQTPAPCPSTSTTSTSTSNAAATTLPTAGATAKSQASRTTNPLTPTQIFQLVFSLFFIILAAIVLGLCLYYIYTALRITIHHRRPSVVLLGQCHTQGESEFYELTDQRREIVVVRESGRRLSSVSRLDREIVVVGGSAKPWKEGVVVDKGIIRVVEGSGRPFGCEERGGMEGVGESTVVEGLGHVVLAERESI